jgi:hypothetical protein
MLDRADYVLTLVRLSALDWLAPPVGRSGNRASACEGVSAIDFDTRDRGALGC